MLWLCVCPVPSNTSSVTNAPLFDTSIVAQKAITTEQSEPINCDIGDPSKRVDCGYHGIQRDECLQRDCCWKESSISGEPWCFYAKNMTDKVTISSVTHVPMYSTSIISKFTTERLEPNCDIADPLKRVDCGHHGIQRGECLQRDCCWKESSISGVPWCFYAKNMTDKVTTSSVTHLPLSSMPISIVQKATTTGGLEPNCDIGDPSTRIDCGYHGIQRDECLKRKCCWKESSISGAPWCFFGKDATTQAPVQKCDVRDPSKRIDCGWSGIQQDQCRQRMCCWKESSVDGVPWCFYGENSTATTATANRLGKWRFRCFNAPTQWRRQLWGTGARPPPSTSNNFFFLVYLGANLTANYSGIVYSLRDQLVQMSTTHSSFDPYCISHKTISHQAAAAPGREVRRECLMT